MEVTQWAERQNAAEVGQNVREELCTIGENAGYIKQGLARVERWLADSETSPFSRRNNN